MARGRRRSRGRPLVLVSRTGASPALVSGVASPPASGGWVSPDSRAAAVSSGAPSRLPRVRRPRPPRDRRRLAPFSPGSPSPALSGRAALGRVLGLCGGLRRRSPDGGGLRRFRLGLAARRFAGGLFGLARRLFVLDVRALATTTAAAAAATAALGGSLLAVAVMAGALRRRRLRRCGLGHRLGRCRRLGGLGRCRRRGCFGAAARGFRRPRPLRLAPPVLPAAPVSSAARVAGVSAAAGSFAVALRRGTSLRRQTAWRCEPAASSRLPAHGRRAAPAIPPPQAPAAPWEARTSPPTTCTPPAAWKPAVGPPRPWPRGANGCAGDSA